MIQKLFHSVRWVCTVLLAVVFFGQLAVVFLRYLLGVGFVELQDAVAYAFAALVALSVAVAFDDDKHVRVDVFRQKFSGGLNRKIDLLGDLFLTLPVFAILLWTGFPLVRSSWEIFEGSRETGGLPGLFLVKTCLILLPTLVLVLALRRLSKPRWRDAP